MALIYFSLRILQNSCVDICCNEEIRVHMVDDERSVYSVLFGGSPLRGGGPNDLLQGGGSKF